MLRSLSNLAGFHVPLGGRVLLVVCAAVLALSALGSLGRDATYGRPGAAVAGAVNQIVDQAQFMSTGSVASRNQALGLLRAAEMVSGQSLQKHTDVDVEALRGRLEAASAMEEGEDDIM